jgi:hypothetical protein
MRLLTMYAGADMEFSLLALDENGDPVDLTGSTLTFQVRRGVLDDDPLIEKATGDGITHAADQAGAGKGQATLTLEALDTEDLNGQHRWGLWVEDVFGTRQPLSERGVFYVSHPVVRPGGS